jgi:hypothetical protein
VKRKLNIFAALTLCTACIGEPSISAPDAGNNTDSPADMPVVDMSADTAADAVTPDVGEPDMRQPDMPADMGSCGMCADDLPVCDSQTGECVGCLQDTDCDGVCIDNTCTECRQASDCPTDNPICDTATNLCAPCQTSTDCAARPDTPVCDSGMCVECTASEQDHCTGVCDTGQRLCTDIAPQSAQQCDECVSDAHCMAGMGCVMMEGSAEDGRRVSIGNYCLWREDASNPGPDGSCSVLQQTISSLDATSIDGVDATFCGPRTTTCAALKTFDLTCGSDADCGHPDVVDGLCAIGVGRCTYPCMSGLDCGLVMCTPDADLLTNVCAN